MNKNWDDYRLEKGDDIEKYFAQERFLQSEFLYILGRGFDDRMCMGLEKLISNLKDITICCINYDEGEQSPSKEYQDKVIINTEKFASLTHDKRVVQKTIKMWIEDGNEERNVTEIETNKLVRSNSQEINRFTDIIIDISALPQSVYFGLINRIILECFDNKRIYIIVSENYQTDMQTKAVEPDEFAHEILGFIGSSSNSSDEHLIWFPVLGEMDEICILRVFRTTGSVFQNHQYAVKKPPVHLSVPPRRTVLYNGSLKT